MPFRKKPGAVLVIIGGVILIVALVILIAFPSLYKIELNKQTTLVENTVLYKLWKDLPIPIYQKFYFFNITNKEGFLNSAESYSVKEVGPYTYSSKWVKKHICHEDGTVSFREVKTYFFEPDMSVGSEDDKIWTLNGPYATAGHIVGAQSIHMQRLANLEFKLFEQELIIEKTIRELTFKGYKDKLLSSTAVQAFFKNPYKDGNFSWFYNKNATDDGLFTVYTGAINHSDVNTIKCFNGDSKLNFWENDTCNELKGTNGELGPPLVDNQKTYSFFQPLACRTLTFDYTGEHVHRGINCKRFQNTYKIFATPKINPDNHCFIKDKKQRSGVLDIGSCQYDAPVYLSFPHFYLADPSYFLAVDGLLPDDDIHKSYIDVEPVTGVSVCLAIRIQVNLRIDRNPHLHQFENVTSGIYPVFWTEISAAIDEELSNTFDNQLRKPKSIAYSVLGTLSLLSGGILFWGLGLMRKHRNRMWEEIQPLIEDDKSKVYDSNKDRVEPKGNSPNFQLKYDQKLLTGTRTNLQVNPCGTCFDENCGQTTRSQTSETYSVYEGIPRTGAIPKK